MNWASIIFFTRASISLLLLSTVVVFSSKSSLAAPASGDALSPRELILLPHEGDRPLDEKIAALQKRIAASADGAPHIERLGMLFIEKARTTGDPGYYKLAEQCALAVLAKHPSAHDALLLQGHVMGAMHRFSEAEAVARRLIEQREHFLDHALLGDMLMEQGRLDEAVVAYQMMIDLRPGLQSYTRVAHVRWLKGDLEGAIELMNQAVQTGAARDPEPVAWSYARLALYQLEQGEGAAAMRSASRALELLPDYPVALLARGRILLGQEDPASAVAPLEKAAAQVPLPEYLWVLADALRAAERETDAAKVEAQLDQTGARSDPRTFSLYLSTRRKDPERALALAKVELEERSDVFTHDALAWAHFAAGNLEQASEHSAKAVAEGTEDARLWLHSGLISSAAGRLDQARAALQKAASRRQMLLPGEISLLDQELAALAGSSP